MKFNSQICTTKNQSERLLALGLKKETADCIITQKVDGTFDVFNINCGLLEVETIKRASKLFVSLSAWSLHRLMEIYEKTCIFWTDCLDNPYEAMISRIADKIKWGELNKEYLEDSYEDVHE